MYTWTNFGSAQKWLLIKPHKYNLMSWHPRIVIQRKNQKKDSHTKHYTKFRILRTIEKETSYVKIMWHFTVKLTFHFTAIVVFVLANNLGCCGGSGSQLFVFIVTPTKDNTFNTIFFIAMLWFKKPQKWNKNFYLFNCIRVFT